MANANSLILLPPRHTAQTTHDSSKSKSAKKPEKDDTFGRKLEKAKTAKLPVAVKKPAADEAPKAKVSTVVAAKPAKPAVEDTESEKPDPEAKKNQKALDQPAIDPQVTQPDAKAPEAAKASPAIEEAIHQAVDKKPVKTPKDPAAKVTTVTTPPTPPTPTPVAVNPKADIPHPAATKPTATPDGSDAKSVVTAVGGDKDQSQGADQEDDAGDPTDAAVSDGEFGSGKIVTAGGKNASVASRQGAVDQNPAATAAATIANPDLDDDATTATASTGKISAKAESHIEGLTAKLLDPTPSSSPQGTTQTAGKTTVTAAAPTPAARFVEENHPKIVTSIAGQLLPNGGTVQLQLNPKELGALQVTVQMKEGVMTASFETSNDDATKLLSHSLGQLKSSLEAAGVSVDKIQVEQAPRKQSTGDSGGDSRQTTQDKQGQAQQDQQRREMVQRMWRKLAGGGDPLDLVA